MTDIHHTRLCVGGPLDGQRKEPDSRERSGFRVAVNPRLSALPEADRRFPPPRTITLEYVHYDERVFRTKDGDISFWAAEDVTNLELMTRLAAGYRAPNKRP